MPSVAEQLRQGREARGWTVHQLADLTKIRTDHIRALEEGNYNVFSAPVYIQGFVRTCATLCKLDVPNVMVQLENELSQTEKFHEHPRLMGERKGVIDFIMLQFSKINWRVGLPLLIFGIIIAGSIFGYRAWQERKTEDPLKNLSSGVYQPDKGARPASTNTTRTNR